MDVKFNLYILLYAFIITGLIHCVKTFVCFVSPNVGQNTVFWGGGIMKSQLFCFISCYNVIASSKTDSVLLSQGDYTFTMLLRKVVNSMRHLTTEGNIAT